MLYSLTPMKNKKENKKTEIKVKTLWDFSDVVKNDKGLNFKKLRLETEKRTEAFIKKWKEREDYLYNPEALLEALNEYERWKREYGAHSREVYYFSLRFEENQENTEIKAGYQQALERAKHLSNSIRFFSLRLSKIDSQIQQKFLSYAPLFPYRHYLERIFAEAKYLLSEKEENLLSLMETPAYENWTIMTEGALAKETRKLASVKNKKKVFSFSELLNLITDKDKKTRDEANKEVTKIMEEKSEMAVAEMNSILLYKKTEDNLRGFTRPDAGRHLSDDIDTKIVDTLIKTVTANFSVAHRFYSLKARLFKVKKLAYHERAMTYGKANQKYDYKKSFNLVNKVFREMDGEFSQILEKLNSEGRIDVFPKKGKSSGAFCAHSLPKLPTYILLNHTNRLHDVLTLSHEAGHAINNELMRKKQNALNCDTSLAIAEVASTFMEDFVLAKLGQEVDEETRLALMVAKLDDDMATIFRQTAAYNFERELHLLFRKKGFVSGREINKLFLKHMENYLGSSVELGDGVENWWVYWSHFRNFFYVYSYVSGLLISKALQLRVKKDKDFINQTKEIFSAGTSKSPQEIFFDVGLNIEEPNFWKTGIEETKSFLEETEKLAKKLGKI